MQPENTSTPQSAAHSPDDLLSVREAAAVLHASVMTLNNWRSLRLGPRFHKIGKRIVRYKRSDLLAFIETGAHGKVQTPEVRA